MSGSGAFFVRGILDVKPLFSACFRCTFVGGHPLQAVQLPLRNIATGLDGGVDGGSWNGASLNKKRPALQLRKTGQCCVVFIKAPDRKLCRPGGIYLRLDDREDRSRKGRERETNQTIELDDSVSSCIERSCIVVVNDKECIAVELEPLSE